ncbi:MAG: DUF4198 domain-containing protein [Caldimonas sp.]
MKRHLLTIALLLSTAAGAHEYWLLPDRFAAATAEPIGIGHRVGTGWPGEALPRNPARIVRFALVDANGEQPIDGDPGADPAGVVALRAPGIAVAVYRSRPSPLSLDAAPFESYLRDEGLERIIERRAARGESALPGLEMFSRCAKTLLVADGRGAGDPARWRRPVGLTLELVPETDPRGLAGGGSFAVRLLHRGRPLEGALVKALPKDGNERRLSARSDRQGRVRFALPEGGIWLINAVHMIDAPAGSGARWESLWSSLTFEAGAGASPSGGTPLPKRSAAARPKAG